MADDVKGPREVKSKREILDSAGQPQKDWLDAGGVKYTSLTDDFSVTLMFSEGDHDFPVLPDAVVRAYAAFGGLTHLGNITNTVRNGLKSNFASEREALEAAVADLLEGNWTSQRGETEAGPTLLLQALVRVKDRADGKVRGEAEIKALGDWLSAQDIAEGDARKKAAADRRKTAKAVRGVAEAILDIQRERLSKRGGGETVDAGAIPG